MSWPTRTVASPLMTPEASIEPANPIPTRVPENAGASHKVT